MKSNKETKRERGGEARNEFTTPDGPYSLPFLSAWIIIMMTFHTNGLNLKSKV